MSEQKETVADNTVSSAQETIFAGLYDLAPYEKTLKSARIWLYVIAGIQLAMGIFEYNTIAEKDLAWMVFGIDAFVAAIFLVLALWSRKSPVPAFTTALICYLLFNVIFMILDPTNIARGIIVKVLVTVALVKANRDARKYEEIKRSIG
jgi:hypothetical protein